MRGENGRASSFSTRTSYSIPSLLGCFGLWQQDALFGTDSDAQMKAITMYATSFPYIGFVIWGTSNDLPQNIADIPYLGRMLKPAIWLLSSLSSSAWGLEDSSTVGFLVGVGILGLGAGLALACLMYSGSESI